MALNIVFLALNTFIAISIYKLFVLTFVATFGFF